MFKELELLVIWMFLAALDTEQALVNGRVGGRREPHGSRITLATEWCVGRILHVFVVFPCRNVLLVVFIVHWVLELSGARIVI